MTPSRWTLFAPVWARWLVSAVMTTGAFVAAMALTMPPFRSLADWPWKAVVSAGFGLTLAGAMLYAQKPWRDIHIAALKGLDSAQQRVALQALRRGEAPADPAALAGAIRVGALTLSYRRRMVKSQKLKQQWWVPGIYAALAILYFVTHEPRKGLLWLGFALLFAAYFESVSWRARRLQRQVGLLHQAAQGVPEAEAAIAAAADGAPALPRRIWLMVTILVIIGAWVGVTIYSWGFLDKHRSPHARDCSTVGNAVGFLNKHPELLDAKRIAPGGLSLDSYSRWSDQLHTYARQLSDPDLSAYLKREAELAADAVAVVRDVRENAGVAAKPNNIQGYEDQYTRIMSDLVMQSGKATDTCTRH